ncbi:hypothetical protein D3C78_561280 [compost metagenome]
MLAAVGPVLIARLPFGGVEVAQADAVFVAGRVDLINMQLPRGRLNLEIHLTRHGTWYPQGEAAQGDIQSIAAPQTAARRQAEFALRPDRAKQIIPLIELAPCRQTAQQQAVENFTAIAVREGNLNIDRIINLSRLYQGQLARGLIDGINAVIELHMLYVMERLDDSDAPFTHAEIKPGIMD